MQSRLQFQQNKIDTAPKTETPLRCDCGSLLARVVPSGVELKCRRCKRQVIIQLDMKGTLKISI
jgi:phage FluMu protein Com